LPAILSRAGAAAGFCRQEFSYGKIRNGHTRAAYLIAVRRFLAWAEGRQIELVLIAPKDVSQYLGGLRESTSVATRRQHLAAIRQFFDNLVTRHAIILNPALSVRGEQL